MITTHIAKVGRTIQLEKNKHTGKCSLSTHFLPAWLSNTAEPEGRVWPVPTTPLRLLGHSPARDHRPSFPTTPGPEGHGQMEQKEHWSGSQESRFGFWLYPRWGCFLLGPLPKARGGDRNAALFCLMILIFLCPNFPHRLVWMKCRKGLGLGLGLGA